MPPRRSRIWLGVGLTVGSALGILILTLHPADGRHEVGGVGMCLICGEFGLANILRNVLLFFPLGVGLGMVIRRPLLAWLPGLALTCFVETAQLLIPGRNPLLIDVVANAAGAAAGVVLVQLLLRAHPLPRHLRVARAAFLSLPFLVVVATSFAFQLHVPPAPHFSQLAPNLFHTSPYPGAVTRGSVGSTALNQGRHPAPSELEDELFGGTGLRLQVDVDGAPSRARGALVSIRNASRAETFYMGIEAGTGVSGDEVVVRLPYRAAPLRLDRPFLRTRLPPALDPSFSVDYRLVAPGRAGAASSWDGPPPPIGVCLAVDQDSVCGVRPTLGRGWGLLLSPPGVGLRFRRLLDGVWVLGLGVLPGLLLRSVTGRLVFLVGLLVTAAAAPALLNSLAWTPASQLLLLAVGFGLGISVQSRIVPRTPPAQHRGCLAIGGC